MTRSAVLVVGSLHYDIVVDAPHLPGRDETVMGHGVAYVCGGKGGNQAVAASRHGASVAMAGRVGDDASGVELVRNLQAAGVDTNQVAIAAGEASGMSVAVVDDTGDYGAVVVSGVNRGIAAADIAFPQDVAVLVLQNEIPANVNLSVAQQARSNGVRVVLNAAPMREFDEQLTELTDILVVNRVEAAALLGSQIDKVGDAVALAEKRKSGPEHLIVTLGNQGLVYRQLGRPAGHVSPWKVDVTSSHGAGDTFVGAFAARLAAGAEMADALEYANAAAALFVSTPLEDRAAITPDSVRALLSRRKA